LGDVFVVSSSSLVTSRSTTPPQPVVDRRYFYDTWGNLDCVTSGAGGMDDCAPPFGIPTPEPLLESYVWDYLNRLEHASRFEEQDEADYEHDPLNRLVKETETHENGIGNRRTCFSYRGASSETSAEATVGSTQLCTATPATTKSYAYDETGERVALTQTGGPQAGLYFYARNLHTDVSVLETDGGAIKASYAYKPYGAEDDLSTGDLEGPAPINAFRFNDKRLDSGSATVDMGARRYSSGVARFVQPDFYDFADADLTLATSESLSNRYGFAGGNPISSVEVDGHYFDTLGTQAYAFVSPAATCGTRLRSLSSRGRYGNGCGPGGLTGKLVPEGIRTVVDFSAACEGHDRCYGTWGTWRFQCDRRFREDMEYLCPPTRIGPEYNTIGPSYPGYPNPQGIACYKAARIYYQAVKRLGKGSFIKAQRKQISSCRGGTPLVPRKTRAACEAAIQHRALYPNERRR
jgi:RHS repeat-associated protein